MNHFIGEPVEDLLVKGCSLRIVGTAHVSKASKEFVAEQVNKGSYDCVAVELCSSRFQQLTDPASLEAMDLFQVIKQKRVTTLAVMLAMGAFQQRIAAKFDLEPGAELKIAVDLARTKNLPIELIDRDIGTTLSRFFGMVSWWERLQVFGGLFTAIVTKDDPSEEEVESLKKGDLLEQVISSLAESSPSIHAVLIAERDKYMAAKLITVCQKKREVIAIVGAGHLKGLCEILKTPFDNSVEVLRELDTKPQKRKWWRVVPFVILAFILSGFLIGFYRSPSLGFSILVEWVVINGGLSALGVLIASGHPLTILTAFFAAPITSLNPTIGAGMVTGLAEAWLRKPTVSDFANLKEDSGSFSGWRKNRVARTFLVFILSSFGSAIGTYVAGFRIFGKLLA